MNRVAFRLQVRAELIGGYRAHHAAVWPEMREALHRSGWHNYSLHLDGDGALFGYFETAGTLADAVEAMQHERINARWQALMAPYFVTGDAPGGSTDACARGGLPPPVSHHRYEEN